MEVAKRAADQFPLLGCPTAACTGANNDDIESLSSYRLTSSSGNHAAYCTRPSTTAPDTSVSRKSRPWNL
jgi:hypothetical protein